MIIKKNERTVTEIKNLMAGIGTIKKHEILAKEDLQSGRLYAKMTIKVGDSIGKHTHNGESETYFILKGTAMVNDNGTKKNITEGDISVTKSGEFHSIENIGADDLEFIALIIND